MLSEHSIEPSTMGLAKSGVPIVDPAAPWAGDPFERRAHGERLARLIETLGDQSYVISLNGDWGTGKSVFLNRLEYHLEIESRIPVIRIDAWRSDDADDPIVPFAAAMEHRLAKGLKGASAERKSMAMAIKSSAGRLAVPAAALLANILVPGSAAVAAIAETAATFGERLIDWESNRESEADKFRAALSKARDALTRRETSSPIEPVVVAIDELDRCRPDYAIKVLERIKHFFDVPGIVFLIATDKGNLPSAVNAVYGQNMDGEKYLRKFFDFEYYLPRPTASQYISVLWEDFGMQHALAALPSSRSSLEKVFARPDTSNYAERVFELDRSLDAYEFAFYFKMLASALDLSLRDQSQAFTMLNAYIRTSPRNAVFLPVIDCFLCILRFSNSELFTKLYNGRASFSEISGATESPVLRQVLGDPTLQVPLDKFFQLQRNKDSVDAFADYVGQLRNINHESFAASLRLLNRCQALGSGLRNYVGGVIGLVNAFSELETEDDEGQWPT